MIAHLAGTVTSVTASSAVIDVGGVGLEARCTARALASLQVGRAGRLETSFQLRQDGFALYGFVDTTERETFELLLGVNSVGPKLALAALSLLDPPALVAAITTEDIRALTRIPGVGRKSAERMVVELKDRITALGVAPTGDTGPAAPAVPLWREQVSSGLEGLGWSAKDAELACDAVEPRVAENPSIGVAELMRAALQSLAR